MHERQLLAAKQAMEEAKKAQGSVESQAVIIQDLLVAKGELTEKVEHLSEENSNVKRDLANAIDEVGKKRIFIAELQKEMKELERQLAEERLEVERLLGVERDLRVEIADGLEREKALGEHIEAARQETAASEERCAEERAKAEAAREVNCRLERTRDEAIEASKGMRAKLEETVQRCEREMAELKAQVKRDMDAFLAKVTREFEEKTRDVIVRSRMLEREVA